MQVLTGNSRSDYHPAVGDRVLRPLPAEPLLLAADFVIRRSWTERLLLLAGRRPGRVFLGTAIVVGTALVAAVGLTFDADVLTLLPKRDPDVLV